MAAPGNKSVRRIERYELHEEFARGGMARVHLGRLVGPVGFTRAVAIKCLHPGYANDPAVVRMFIDEARIASRISHPNVVPIIDVIATGGELFLVMDYVRGASLSKLAAAERAKGQIAPLGIVLGVMIQALSGLHAAHEASGENGEPLGIVHRDVSPQNVLIGEDGIARVLDFGVAKAASRLESTAEGQIKGKIAYMSPEQLDARAVDCRSDIFSASVVLWELLTGRPLFASGETSATISAIVNLVVAPPSSINPLVPPWLDAVVLRGLSRSIADRPKTALELVKELEAFEGIASNREIGQWVRSLARDDLRRNAEALAQLENPDVSTSILQGSGALQPPSGASLSTSLATDEGAPPSEGSLVSTGGEPASNPRPRAFTRIVAAVAGVGAFVFLAIFFNTRQSAKVDMLAAETPSHADNRTVSPPIANVVASVSSVVAPTATASSTETVNAPAPSVVAAVASTPTPTRSGKVILPRRAVPVSGRADRDDCRVLHADGTFSYRPECLRK